MDNLRKAPDMRQQAIEVFAPRWHDRKALIAAYKMKTGENLVRFTRAGTYNGLYTVSGYDVFDCPLETNGKIDCYAVPLSRLRRLDGEE